MLHKRRIRFLADHRRSHSRRLPCLLLLCRLAACFRWPSRNCIRLRLTRLRTRRTRHPIRNPDRLHASRFVLSCLHCLLRAALRRLCLFLRSSQPPHIHRRWRRRRRVRLKKCLHLLGRRQFAVHQLKKEFLQQLVIPRKLRHDAHLLHHQVRHLLPRLRPIRIKTLELRLQRRTLRRERHLQQRLRSRRSHHPPGLRRQRRPLAAQLRRHFPGLVLKPIDLRHEPLPRKHTLQRRNLLR